MIKNLHFEKLELKFLPEVFRIEQQAFVDPWSFDAMLAECENPIAHYVVGLIETQVVSYGGFWKILDEGHITNIAVSQGYRVQGIGEKMLSTLIAKAKELGIERMTLEVRISNLSAIALYAKLGFKSVGIRPRYYPDGENANIFWLEIKEQGVDHYN